MRAYFFGNMYLRSIQQGIQAAHVTHEMFNKYQSRGPQCNSYLWDWSENHKTMILLNAGYGDNIRNLVSIFEKKENPYPWADFHEGQDSLDGALTCVGIVLPEKIYETAAFLRRIPFRDKKSAIESIKETGEARLPNPEAPGLTTVYELSKWEFELVLEIGNYGMAS